MPYDVTYINLVNFTVTKADTWIFDHFLRFMIQLIDVYLFEMTWRCTSSVRPKMGLNVSKIHMLLNTELRHILLYGLFYTSGFNVSWWNFVERNHASLFMTFWILIHIIQVKEALAQFLKVEMKIFHGPLSMLHTQQHICMTWNVVWQFDISLLYYLDPTNALGTHI